MGKFEDKVVIVMGVSRGAGKKLAIRSYEEGAVVGLLGLDGQNPDAVVREANLDTGRFLTYVIGVSNNRQVISAIDDIGKRLGRIDILINNAGVLHKGTVKSSTNTHIKLMVDVNLIGPMYCTHASVSYTKENDGNIINVSSILAALPSTSLGVYGATKVGTVIPTRVWAAGLAPRKTRVSRCAPGVSNTPTVEDVTKNRAEGKLCQIPLRRSGETDDVLDLISFFYPGQASYITGQTTGLDGGIWVIQMPAAAWKL